MSIKNSDSSFGEQVNRIRLITGSRTQAELAKFLGVQQPAVSTAIRRGAVPFGWLLFLLRVMRANPDWILSGRGPVYIPAMESCGETDGDAPIGRVLRLLPARVLTDELLRRIEAAQSAG